MNLDVSNPLPIFAAILAFLIADAISPPELAIALSALNPGLNIFVAKVLYSAMSSKYLKALLLLSDAATTPEANPPVNVDHIASLAIKPDINPRPLANSFPQKLAVPNF